MSHDSVFTCVTCNVAFNTFELQRDHYKTDWHRYNLKRKIAELPSVSHKEFQERLSMQKAQVGRMNESAQNPPQEEMFCKLCSKHFSTANAFANHLNSKKHKELLDATVKTADVSMKDSFAIKGDRNAKKTEQVHKAEQAVANMEDGDEKDWEDVDEEASIKENIDEAQGIDLKSCLFCTHKNSSIEAKCEHMAREHSFFIPDMEHVVDIEGLLRFLGVKVGAYHVCLWCSSKCYRSLDAVQKHMSDKGHQKMRFEGETLLEYADFYEYDDEESLDNTDASYDVADDFDIKTISRISSSFKEDIENDDSLGDVSYELVLPSGAKIGHRSLFKYYKQSFGHRNLEQKKKSSLSVKDKYKAIAYGQSYSAIEIQKQRKDLAYFQRWSAKLSVKLGWETNKLQKHFRRQDICF